MHAFVFLLISITLPEIKTKEIDFIPVEIVEEKEIKEKEIIKKVNTPKKEKKIHKPIINNPPPPQKKPAILDKKENILAEKEKFIPEIPTQKPKFKAKKPKEKIIEKNEDIFDDMLKNLEKPDPIKEEDQFDKIVNDLAINNPKKEKTDKPKNNVKVTNETLAILKSNIKKQIRKHYTIPPALDSVLINDVKVPITITIRKDGKITRIIISKNALKRAQNDPIYRSFLEAAERAVKKLSKFDKLPLDLYSHWDKISINFTPI
tara:strand:+ start:2401 stop:3186 length:786 start_codon:yes stop_codon:yes gene_type:complete